MKTVYFVHDQQESPTLRHHYLEMAGFTVRLLAGAKDLFVALKEAVPDLVLMDTLLEGRNGFEVCREIDLRIPTRSFPIVLCTTIYRARQFRDEAFRFGAQDYLLLPVTVEEFMRRIRMTLAGFVPKMGPLDTTAA